MLYVQKPGKESVSLFPPLQGGLGNVVSDFLLVWCVPGNAFFCVGIIVLLKETFW